MSKAVRDKEVRDGRERQRAYGRILREVQITGWVKALVAGEDIHVVAMPPRYDTFEYLPASGYSQQTRMSSLIITLKGAKCWLTRKNNREKKSTTAT